MEVKPKHWNDEVAMTVGKSKFEGLIFPADRYWEECKITLNGNGGSGKHPNQKFIVYLNGEKVYDKDLHGSYTFTRLINAEKEIVVSGQLEAVGIRGTGSGSVDVACSYKEGSVLNTETAESPWSDETAGISCIDNLVIATHRKWKRCVVTVEGKQNKGTGCMISVVTGSDIVYVGSNPAGGWSELTGTDQTVYTIDLTNCEAGPIVVGGYITFHPTKGLSGGGATISLTGIYEQ